MDVNGPRLPSYATCSPEEALKYASDTQDGRWSLLSYEVFWRDRYNFLKNNGYQLRPRFSPEWIPSWTGTNYDPFFCEDSIISMIYNVIDATRTSDGSLISIKSVSRTTNEIAISRMLSSKDLTQDSPSHCVPILDVLDDPNDSTKAMIIMPYLRPFDDPELRTIGEVVDFISQTLEVIPCFDDSVDELKVSLV
ncbi:hypothetical protein QCA50_008375 [Cerrena zonata]|uniref:Uncharacterized protein n=1 Tax=Cerrena zonata TaxID=2478898 RepID=A0AAW0G3D4_9APHY